MLDADYEFRLNNFATTACDAVVKACLFLVLYGELLITPLLTPRLTAERCDLLAAGSFSSLLGLSFDLGLFGRLFWSLSRLLFGCCLCGPSCGKRKLGQSSSPIGLRTQCIAATTKTLKSLPASSRSSPRMHLQTRALRSQSHQCQGTASSMELRCMPRSSASRASCILNSEVLSVFLKMSGRIRLSSTLVAWCVSRLANPNRPFSY